MNTTPINLNMYNPTRVRAMFESQEAKIYELIKEIERLKAELRTQRTGESDATNS